MSMSEKRYSFTVQDVLGQTQTVIVTGNSIEVAQDNFWNRDGICKHTHKITNITEQEEAREYTESK